jgi:hypothetical protein
VSYVPIPVPSGVRGILAADSGPAGAADDRAKARRKEIRPRMKDLAFFNE